MSQMNQTDNLKTFSFSGDNFQAFITFSGNQFDSFIGGTRINDYKSREHAKQDSINLAQAMSLKTACAEVPLHGAKGVIWGDPRNISQET